jgi:hypothetical protein
MPVPNAPGVPAMPPGQYLGGGDGFVGGGSDQADSNPPTWGVFQDGELIIEPDTISVFEFRQEFNVSDYPVEEGGFASYNKVQLPYDVRVSLIKGGSIDDRAEFLVSIDEIIGKLDLYDVQTPEQVYSELNFTHRNFRRTNENGVGLLLVELWAVEIRETGESAFSSQQSGTSGSSTSQTGSQTKGSSGAKSKDDGAVKQKQANQQQSQKSNDFNMGHSGGGTGGGGGGGW